MPPAHEPTAENKLMVTAWAGAGFTQEAMAYHLAIDPKTLRQHYRTELDQGKELANSMVAGKLFRLALGGDFQAMRFWLQTQARWATKHEMEISGAIETKQSLGTIDLARLSPEARLEMLDQLEAQDAARPHDSAD